MRLNVRRPRRPAKLAVGSAAAAAARGAVVASAALASASGASSSRPSVSVEEHSINVIPREERGGRVWHLGSFWFAANQQFLTVVTGVLAVVLGLNLFWAIVAIVVGNLVGTVFMAYHSAQGPQLGVTQLIQSRGQFGFYGGLFLFVAAFFLSFGFFASETTLSGQALNELSSGISVPAGFVIISLPILVLAILGYRWLHVWQRVASVVLVVIFTIVTVQAVAKASTTGLPGGALSAAAPDWPVFLVVVSIAGTYAISWAPFVSDYSRYLPEETSVSHSFWWTYGGTVVSCIWLEILGSLVALLYPHASPAGALGALSGSWVVVIMALSLIGAGATNLYSGMLALATAASTWWEVGRSIALRISGILLTFLAGFVIALTGYHSFLTNFTDFLLVLAFVFIPWTAINLTDFYIVRRGQYDTPSFFTARGVYGGFIWQSLLAYLIGLGVEFPFINQAFYKGPLVSAVGGADISWIIGILLPAVLYYLVCTIYPPAGIACDPAMAADIDPTAAPAVILDQSIAT